MQELAKSISELVNSLNGGAKGLADAMQRVAPDAWRIAVRAQITNAVVSIALEITLFVVALMISRKLVAYGRNEDTSQEGAGACYAATFCLACVAIWMVCSLNLDLQRLLNPEFYAAADILKALK